MSKKGFYGLIAITLIICLSLAVYLTSGLNTNPFTSQNTNQTQSISPTPNAHEPENSNETAEPITESQNNTALLTKEEAMQIATPALEQYAKEHNRTITGIYASFNATAPAWHVSASFARIELDLTDSSEDAHQYWILGYQAYVKADTGEILSTFPMSPIA